LKEIRPRLVRCFTSVFPELSASEIEQANAEKVEGWDSITAVTLANVVEEEFGILFEPEELPELASFQGFVASLERRAAAEG
jgi:acyl carrier protein